MTYINYEYYKSLYGDSSVDETTFNRLSYEVCRKLDNETTGVDGVRKLQIAFPDNNYDSESVKRCLCKMVEVANDIESVKKQIQLSSGYVQREDGTVVSKKISSISSGSESISYYTGNGSPAIIEKAAMEKKEEVNLYRSVINEYLSGVKDSNGVNLLYMGRYPY